MNTVNDNQPFIFSPTSTNVGWDQAAQLNIDGTPRASATLPAVDPLVQITVQEIAEIVREVAAAVRSEQSADSFLGFFVDRVLRAMAAEGVIVWHRSESDSDTSQFRAVRSVGNMNESSIPNQSLQTHQRLLVEIAAESQAVVVPSTPGASDGDVPANPTDFPVAVLGIESDPTSKGNEYLLEVFLDPKSGVATQRGYLRFAAQMADLAGEFLRADELRRIRQSRKLIARVDESIVCLHDQESSSRVETELVDLASDLFALDQVGLCEVDGDRIQLTAVSHVNDVDLHSPSALRLINAAASDLNEDGFTQLEFEDQSDGLNCAVVVGTAGPRPLRLIGLTQANASALSHEQLNELKRLLVHADLAIRQVQRFESIPGGRFLASLVPSRSRNPKRASPPIFVLSLLTLLMVAAFFPLPLVVNAPATIRPADVQTLTSPRDAIVGTLHVDDGQIVQENDPLVTLVDPVLERELTELIGRRAVLAQQQSRWTQALVDSPSSSNEDYEQMQGRSSLVSEEIESINRQAELLNEIKASLVIRADRQGKVDGWRLRQRLDGKPLRRGDQLMSVIADQSDWIVETDVPQNRLRHVQASLADESLETVVCLDSDPTQRWSAAVEKIGPSTASTVDSVATTATLLRIDYHAINVDYSSSNFGAPARATFRCGTAPTVYCLFQDLINTIRGSVGLYVGRGQKTTQVK